MSEQKQDIVKKRRAYLWTKRAYIGVTIIATPFCLFCGCSAILITLLATFFPYICTKPDVWIFTAFLILMGIGGGIAVRSSTKRLKSLPYVPPVAEQIAALPAEAILLRHSDQPSATPEELLRAAQAKVEALSEQLVRSVE